MYLEVSTPIGNSFYTEPLFCRAVKFYRLYDIAIESKTSQILYVCAHRKADRSGSCFGERIFFDALDSAADGYGFRLIATAECIRADG